MERGNSARGQGNRPKSFTPLGFGAHMPHAPQSDRSLDAYAEEVGRYDLLTRADEQRLGAQIALGRQGVRVALARLPLAAELILQRSSEPGSEEWLAGGRRKRQRDINPSPASLKNALGKIRRALEHLQACLEGLPASAQGIAPARRRLARAVDGLALKPQGERELGAILVRQLDQLLETEAGTHWGLSPYRLRACRRRLSRGLQHMDAGRNGLAEGNLRLVIAVARRYAHLGVPLSDLIQEGNLGLMHAIDKYDYQRGFKFSTYATWWIRQAVNRGVADKARTIRVPVHISEQRNKVLQAQRSGYQETGRSLSHEEIADRTGLPMKKVKQICEQLPVTSSLNTPVGSDESATLGDLVADEASPSALDETFEAQRRALAGELLKTLPDRERKVIQMRFGIGLKQPYSLRQIAGQLRMSQESARQLEIEGLRKLRETSVDKVDPESL
jgi:RNA polymerase sigma factor (sigma-70 family)